MSDSWPRLVGIDLGTTNSAVAWIDGDAQPPDATPRLLLVPQLVGPGEIASRATLPSFLYLPTSAELESGSVALPWDPRPDMIVGAFARDHGALVPTRQVSSAKSWLSNPAVDRRAPLLPWTAEESRISPVEASARVLSHIRDAWDHRESGGDATRALTAQIIVLTVPASFDQEARELTVEAARQAGFADLTLIEEPIAAVYAWIASHPRELPRVIADGQVLLVCDVGGGTTDFSLIRARTSDGELQFERIAIGEHLLLGGDNLDVALSALVEQKMTAGGSVRLSLTQRQALRRVCSAAKERLLATDAPERVPITILGSGRGVVGGSLTSELTRDEVANALESFLPRVDRDDRPQHQTRPGLRELGLPYESDPAITRHLAAFLARSARIASDAQTPVADIVRPDAVLFNGGFFTPPQARERVLDALAFWFGERPLVLANDEPDAAVALGAAYYAALKQRPSAARSTMIRAGSPRAYYVALESEAADDAVTAVCVLARGTQEGTQLDLEREFTVIANQPAAFTLLSTTDRDDAPNQIVAFTSTDDVHRHAPLVTALRYGQRSRRVPLKVRLRSVFTEVGTLELWCESLSTEHRWRLQFNLRSPERDQARRRAGESNTAELRRPVKGRPTEFTINARPASSPPTASATDSRPESSRATEFTIDAGTAESRRRTDATESAVDSHAASSPPTASAADSRSESSRPTEFTVDAGTAEPRRPVKGRSTDATEPTVDSRDASHIGAQSLTGVVISDETVAGAEQLVRDAFDAAGDRSAVDRVTGALENLLGHVKHGWPLPVLRRLADVILAQADGRRVSARHEARWLNLVGFCLRPGFGTSLDPWRISEIRKVYAADLAFPKDVQCQVEWLILWQRVSAGFTAPQQQELATRVMGMLGLSQRKPSRLNPQVQREAWRLLAGLERIDRKQRVRVGDELIARVRREPTNRALLWAIGRLGARVPAYGPLNVVVPAAAAERWLETIVAIKSPGSEVFAAAAEIAAKTDDAAREIGDDARTNVLAWMKSASAPGELVAVVREAGGLERLPAVQLYGEPLPQGLRIDSDR